MIEMRHLATLVAIKETGSLTRSAKRVHLTQSALSHQLKRMEDYYRVMLVDRHTHPLALTSTGERLVKLAYLIREAVETAEREIQQDNSKNKGKLRIAIECHTCFDWLMPVMDDFRGHWPDVELDLVSGFHSHPVELLYSDRADLVIISENTSQEGISFSPLFRFELLAVMANDHPLTARKHLVAEDFVHETLITYPVPVEQIDLYRKVLLPSGVNPERRTAELTIAILQLVASRRGLAALPNWGLTNYLDYGYVSARKIGHLGLWSDLYAAVLSSDSQKNYVQAFISSIQQTCFKTLEDIEPFDS
ncbi:MAG TPA: LysR family transcriptional regulator [Burkholderiales bacterium]|nr:LysR family transcriptional regulator [Burkholderiales bacterium]